MKSNQARGVTEGETISRATESCASAYSETSET